MGGKALVEIENLKVSFLDPRHPSKKIEAVKGVSLALGEGSFTSLVGESGSGKTVTGLSLARLARPDEESGKIIWRGADIFRLSERELLDVRGKEISYVFQDPASSFNPVLRVGAQVAEAYRAHFRADARAAAGRALEFLSAVGLKDVRRVYRSYPHQLSGGMRQRAMIAMALISEPKLLVADEPTTALDADVGSEILNLTLKIKNERRLTVLFITHDMAHASLFSDVIYVMKDGTVAERLEKGGGGFSPQGDYTKRLFSASFWNVPVKSILEI